MNLNPPLDIGGEWGAWKLAVRDGRMVVSIGDRAVFERPVPAEAVPWLAIEAPGVLGGSARDFALAGHPSVPERVRLSILPDLAGWSSAEYPSVTPNGSPDWRKRGDEIVGRSTSIASMTDANHLLHQNQFGWDSATLQQAGPPLAGSRLETVLRLARPMLEAGEVEYEFYHEAGKAMVHPSLGRVAFLIHPEGVAIHRLTDAPDDRAGLDPGNRTIEPGRGRGPASPPLRPKAWNRLKLALAGDIVSITLNDVLIHERPVEPTNSRAFGLFHFVDESEARVREVSHRGDWPRSIPAKRE